ncbi:protein LYRIC-like [Carassius carassius]|uniref:protein LYRIC-like n=1 Tax=Carassius carassius TaxID=217509 RepID=UPI002868A555|nr:protein LYRIC-like [Carassius carassius]XP_059424308.1 protein LYRIC-like [Carassius carassius]
MAPGWQEIASLHVEQITGYVRETLSTGLVYLKSELGIDLGLNPDLCAPWLLLSTAWFGLVLILIIWVSICRGLSKILSGTKTGENITDNTSPAQAVKAADEPRRRNRKKNTEKKAQRNGLAVEPYEEAKVVDGQELPEVKTDKAKKNKKKPKPTVKEKKSSTSVDGKEPDEGTWETKVSNREKRQQRRKDKAPGDGSGSPETTAASSAISTLDEIQTTPEEPETTITTTVSTPPVQREVEVRPPEIEASFVRDADVPQVTPCWQEVLAVKGSGWSDLGLQLPPQMTSVQAESWSNMTVPTERQTSEPSVWPQDMEGSWTIVDGSHIPPSFSGLTAVPDLSWSAQPPEPLDDEWSGINSTSVDLSCDWNAPSEEWGNYVVQQPVSAAQLEPPVPEVAQESDNEKDKDEAVAPGSGKAKKKKKKKKKLEDAGPSDQVKAERDASVVATPVQSAAGNVSAASAGPRGLVPSAPVQTQQRMTEPELTDKPTPVPTQKKTDDSRESPKQPVKKKKARRET